MTPLDLIEDNTVDIELETNRLSIDEVLRCTESVKYAEIDEVVTVTIEQPPDDGALLAVLEAERA